jgi:hypothetical protein
MSTKHPEHAIFRDLRDLRHGDDVPVDRIAETESARLALLPPEQRAIELRDLDNRVAEYDAGGKQGLRQQSQAWRLRQQLRGVHEKLRKAGR